MYGGVAQGGQWGTYSMSPGAMVQGRQNGACKNFTRVKNRSQARLHRRQTSSDSSRLVCTVGEGGAKRDKGQNSSGIARGQVGARAPGRTKKFFLYLFFDVFTQILRNTLWITVL